MLRNIFGALCRKQGGVKLVAGAVGVLTGIELLLSARSTSAQRNIAWRNPVEAVRKDYFQIRRTKSELGYTFWVLQGFGKHTSFSLFDTWQEAMEEATLRLKAARATDGSVSFAHA